MKNSKFLLGIMILQIGLLVGMFGSFFYPLWTGTPVKLRVRGYDPRDIFRGNYTQLNYDFSTLYLDSLKNDIDRTKNVRFGDDLYVELQADSKGVFQAVGLWQTPPQTSNVLLKVTPQYTYYSSGSYAYINLLAGIESYFSSPEYAKTLEGDLRNQDSVQVFVQARVASNGVARIEKIDYEIAK